MTIAPHAIIGASTSVFTNSIYIAFLFGIISHFIADATPHLEPNSLVTVSPTGVKTWSIWLYIFVIGEFLLTIYIFWLFRHRSDFALLVAGGLGGLFPDMIVNNPVLAKYREAPILKYIFIFHDKIHLELPIKYWYISALCELTLVGGSLWLLLKF